MEPRAVAALLNDAARWFDPAGNMEITLEANPTSIEVGRLADYRSAGVNRISVGIQSLDDAALQALGRQHSAAEAAAALVLARRLFPRVSFDLIYARPGQDVSGWRRELRTAFDIAADHLSLYQLTIEPATKYEALHRQGKIVLPDTETAATLYNATWEECERAGLAGYEISNYARPGEESRHNLTYWRYLDYSGIGPGAHGRVTIDGTLRATRRHRAPEIWAERVERTGNGLASDEPVAVAERAREALLMGLRLTEGIDRARFQSRTDRIIEDCVNGDVLRQCIQADYLIKTSERLAATRQGRMRLDTLLAELVM
jgi:putative oxygen-independent coproporphyrinogen III oxidase